MTNSIDRRTTALARVFGYSGLLAYLFCVTLASYDANGITLGQLVGMVLGAWGIIGMTAVYLWLKSGLDEFVGEFDGTFRDFAEMIVDVTKFVFVEFPLEVIRANAR